MAAGLRRWIQLLLVSAEGGVVFEGVTLKVADGEERSRALELRRRIYAEELGFDPIDDYDAEAPQLVAIDAHQDLIGAFRIVMPWQRPLELERFVDLSEVLPAGRSPGQVGALWIRPDHRRISSRGFLPLAMLKLAYEFARKHAITDFVMRTPVVALRDFYGRAFFRPLDHLNFRHPVCGWVHVMHLDLVELEALHSKSQDPIARLLFATDMPNIRI